MIKRVVVMGTEQKKNASMIAMAILNTFLFYLSRCFVVLVNCSPGGACSLSLMRMMEYRMTNRTAGIKLNVVNTTDVVILNGPGFFEGSIPIKVTRSNK